jgi:predicted small lipoprotein YifL
MPRALLMLALAWALAGCGLKGPLYHPDTKPAPKPPAKSERPKAPDSKEAAP